MDNYKIIGSWLAKVEDVSPPPQDFTQWEWKQGRRLMQHYMVFTVASPKKDKGKRVMIIHGSKEGGLTPQGYGAYEMNKNSVDEMYCCFPKSVKRHLNDTRIIGMQEYELWVMLDVKDGYLIVTLSDLGPDGP